ncbi:MAG: hypothetical protein EOP50_01470, partial [Sphingobacteriales bacterium]
MKKLINKLVLLIPVAAIALLLVSFNSSKGSEGFEVFQNDKLMLRQFGSEMKNIKTLQLDASSINDEITVKYY